ncbi:TetR/AcrR family transcriptional regulator [Gorillibacterium massiliense]|uniref:TetR/AcrR family transcriptional regulator n=1 Tax=Gorillibacterium massiliense TaxID=1280390 RepID=UPI0004B0D0E1|nr:TetR/AcrR family transcriptional regulator [Gorillibacterium massiliense]
METKSLIVDIAIKLFQQKGYNGVGLNEILQSGKITKGALYHHFPGGKEELLIACIETTNAMICEDIGSIFAAFPTTQAAAIALLDKLIVLYETEGTIAFYTIGSVVSGMDSLHDPVRKACSRLYADMQEIYSNKLMADGYSRDAASSTALMMTASIEGGIMLCLTNRSADPLRVIKRGVSNLLKEF